MITVVSFDFWETLFGFVSSEILNEVRRERIRLYSKLLGLKPEDVEVAYNEVLSFFLEKREKTGFEFTVEELNRAFLKQVGLDDDEMVKKASDIFVQSILKYLPGPVEGAVECIKDISSRGYRLVITSNTIHGQVERRLLKEFDLDRLFDLTIFSSEVRIRKPRREIFHLIARRFHVPVFSIVHIGDDEKADVLGALRAGCWAVHFAKEKDASFRAHFVIRDFEELFDILESINGG